MCTGACPSVQLRHMIYTIIHKSITGVDLNLNLNLNEDLKKERKRKPKEHNSNECKPKVCSEHNSPGSYNTCSYCATSFANSKELAVHQEGGNHTHTDFMCITCLNCYQNQCHLDCHLKRSRCSKPLCKICWKEFNNKRLYDLHLAEIHDIQRPNCDQCGTFFSTAHAFKRHNWRFHNGPRPSGV